LNPLLPDKTLENALVFFFPDVLEAITDAFWAFDTDWLIVYANAAAERIAGRAREEMLGQCLWSAFPELLGTEVEASYRSVAENRRPHTFEYLWRDAWYELRVFLGRNGGVNVYVLDATDRRRMEQESARIRCEAERREAFSG
jgi:PAS domain S-box-containing protein